MGDFYDDIKGDLDKLDQASGGDPNFGADYNSNQAIVREVQAAVNARGYQPPLATDGALGPLTIAGIKWAQAQLGLTADGIIGDQTLGALGITPPGGTSTDSITGAAKGAAAAAIAAIQAEFSSLLDWAQKNPQPITQSKGYAPGFQGTRASVVDSFVPWTSPLEGFVTWPYIDALGYVTTGMGNLIDPVASALSLSWQNADGSPASQAQIQAAWNAVDALRTAAKGQKQSGVGAQGGGKQANYTSIRLTKAGIQDLVSRQMKSNEAEMLKGLANFPQAPASAQLAGHSMSWAMGPGFAVPGSKSFFASFVKAFNAGDYKTAADNSHMQGVGIDMRNAANKLLLQNAAQAVVAKKDPDHLYYLTDLEDLFSTGVFARLIAAVKQNPGKTAAVVATIGSLAALAAFSRKA